MNRFHTPARLAAAVAIVIVGVLSFAAPTSAAGGDSVMIDNATSLTIKTSQALDVTATAQATCDSTVGVLAGSRTVSLKLAGPNGPHTTTKTIGLTSKPCDQSASLDTTINSPKRNGSYTVTLQNGSASKQTTATLHVLIPPARTKDLGVTRAGTVATFTWTANAEPDVTSYKALNSSMTVVTTAAKAEACNGGTRCSTSVDLGPAAAGQSEKFSIRAIRCGRTCARHHTIAGPHSSWVTAHFAAAASATPTPSPRPTPSSTSADGNGSGSDGNGGSGSSGSGAGGASSGSGGQLPGQAGGAAPLPVASAQPSRQITMSPLGPAPAGGTTATATPTPSASPTAIVTAVSDGGGATRLALWRGIAAAAVILLIAVHVLAWTGRRRVD